MLPKRAKVSQLPKEWDVVVIGGGITGAGVALMAAQQQLRVLLVEQQDYAWGTSSRSSKMVHGGLRYLAQGALKLTRESLRERELMLREMPDLVHKKTYLFPIVKKQFPGRWAMHAALWLYDTFAGVREHRWLPLTKVQQQVPGLRLAGAKGAMHYTDAITDDSRLVLRILQEASACGAETLNYVAATDIHAQGALNAVRLHDQITAEQQVVKAKHVINATGSWADALSGTAAKVRPQRGSHLLLQGSALPIHACLTLLHPHDKRPVFVFPWYGTTVVGTTDLDHQQSAHEEAQATKEEIDYLLMAVQWAFPQHKLGREHVLSTQAGVRPIIASGTGKDPSKERRDHLVWKAPGRINVSGGKLTTFRVIALDALLAAGVLDNKEYQRLYRKRQLLQHRISWPAGLGNIANTDVSAETVATWWRWAIRHEQVVHLDDLLLRRTHVGNVCADGGQALLKQHKNWLMQELGWGEQQWQNEVARYLHIWRTYYQP